jgi:hypothetical protein
MNSCELRSNSMPSPPERPQLYHITHIDNLPSILQDGGLRSDAAMLARGGPDAAIGMGSIKSRRLRLPVKCFPDDRVGDYVPFYFCPRSVMLYLLHRGNHPELNYQGGQTPILHLAADMHEVVDWANREGRRWAFSLSNAGAAYTEFRNRLDQLDQVNWTAVAATDFRQPQIKEGKQTEFLVRDFLPLRLIRRIGVYSRSVNEQVATILGAGTGRPLVEIRREWYY